MKYLFIFFGLAFGGAALDVEAQSPRCYSSERFGNALVRVGDSERKVIQADPDRTVRLETSEGGAAGFRHDFYKQGRTVQVYVQAGVVSRICAIREL